MSIRIAVEMRIRSFDLIVCLDFLLKLTMFVTLPPEDQSPKVQRKSNPDINLSRATTTTTTAVSRANQPIEQTKKKMNIVLHLEEPDIILVETLNDPNSNCIIFNVSNTLFDWLFQ